MTKWGKVLLFVAGVLAGGFFEWWQLHQPGIGPSGDEPWALPDFQYQEQNLFDTETVYVTGTLAGADVGYPVNTYNIRCAKNENKCTVANVSEIGRRQLGEIWVDEWPVVSWTPSTIVAQDTVGPTTSCARTTLTITRQAKTVHYTSVPENQTADYCKHFNAHPHVENWQIVNPKQPWGGYL